MSVTVQTQPAEVEAEDANWGSAGGPPLPGRRLIDGEWKMLPYAEWSDADKALAEEIYRNDSEDEEERTLSPVLEAFAVRLENHDEDEWKTLLHLTPVYGDPIAAQVAHFMKTFAADGEHEGDLIRKMLSENVDTVERGSPGRGHRLIDGVWTSVKLGEWTDSDKILQNLEDEKYYLLRQHNRERYLNTLSKSVLIDMINMEYHEKEEMIDANMEEVDME